MYLSMGMVAQAAADEGLTFREILASIPLDPLSIFAMALMAVALGAVVYYGLKSNAPDPAGPVPLAPADEDPDAKAHIAPTPASSGDAARVPAARQDAAPVPPVPSPVRPGAGANPVAIRTMSRRGARGR